MFVVYGEHHSFENLKAWQLARQYRIKIYRITYDFPIEEKYGLTNQLKRAAVSIHSNIAEGYGRYSFKENVRFCRNSRGSLLETLDQLYVALDENYIDLELFKELYKEGKNVEKAINGYIGYLNKQDNNS